jgi:DNA polymerase-3 subunit delta
MSGRAYLLVGKDTFRMAERARVLIDGLLPADSRNVGLETIDGRVDSNSAAHVVSATMQALQTVSLFGGNRLVWLKDAVFLSEKNGGDDDSAEDLQKPAPARTALADLAAFVKRGMPEGLTFLLTATAIDKRSGLYRAFDAAGRVEILDISDKPKEAEQQARRFLDEQIGMRRLKMPEDARHALLERTGADTQALATEIEKLSIYAGGEAVTFDDVVAVAVASKETIIWELTDAIGERNVAGALGVLRQLLFQGESPMAIIAVIERYFRQLAVARDVLDRKWAKLGGRELEWRELDALESALLESTGKMDLRKMHPYRALKLAQQAARRTKQDIRRCRRAVLYAHERLVSSSQSQSLALDILLHRLLA